MQRPIIGYGIDDEGDPIAVLSCGHPQHVRHQPPFINRPWVTSEAGRRSKLGARLNCVRCERFELPDRFIAFERTQVFTEDTASLALKREHSTEAGIWGRIVVLDGSLRYIVEALGTDVELSERRPGIVVPEVPYRLQIVAPVRFFVELYRSPDTPDKPDTPEMPDAPDTSDAPDTPDTPDFADR